MAEEETTEVLTPEEQEGAKNQAELVNDLATKVSTKIDDIAGALKEVAEQAKGYAEAAMKFKEEMEAAVQDMIQQLKDAIADKIKECQNQDPPKIPTPGDIIKAINDQMEKIKKDYLEKNKDETDS